MKNKERMIKMINKGLQCPICKEKSLRLDFIEVDIGVVIQEGPKEYSCDNCGSYWTGPYKFNFQNIEVLIPEQEA